MEAYKYIKRNDIDDADSLIVYEDGTLYVEMDGPEQCYEMKMKREDVLDLYEAMGKLFSDTEPKTLTPEDEAEVASHDLFSLLVAAFTAGEKLGQENANNIYWTTYPKEKVEDAAPKYAKSILGENDPSADTETRT